MRKETVFILGYFSLCIVVTTPFWIAQAGCWLYQTVRFQWTIL